MLDSQNLEDFWTILRTQWAGSVLADLSRSLSTPLVF